MAATIAFALFLGFVCGGMLLALVSSYLDAEEARARKDKVRPVRAREAAETVAAMPGFFVQTDRTPAPRPSLAFEAALLAQLERHVRAEQAIAQQFVHLPSLDSLYRHSGSSLHAA